MHFHTDDDHNERYGRYHRTLKERGIRDNVKVMVGGSPVSKKYANDIGADGYSVNAVEAVRVAKELLNIA